VSGATTPIGYDEAGRLIGEYDAVSPIEETVYVGSMPVAVVKPRGAYYIDADQLNAPRCITDAANTEVWRWDANAFGATAPNGNLSGTPFTYNLRFPGQYYDQETALHYNYVRYYDPSTGRYIESDPIGLGGGLNTYAYVGGNPLIYVDPNGLVGQGVTDWFSPSWWKPSTFDSSHCATAECAAGVLPNPAPVKPEFHGNYSGSVPGKGRRTPEDWMGL
jgi:RHS repeat-associated protein